MVRSVMQVGSMDGQQAREFIREKLLGLMGPVKVVTSLRKGNAATCAVRLFGDEEPSPLVRSQLAPAGSFTGGPDIIPLKPSAQDLRVAPETLSSLSANLLFDRIEHQIQFVITKTFFSGLYGLRW